MIVINSSTRQFNIPGADLVFGVEADSGSTVKEFQCPRYVGNNLDLTGCFIRMNYRNANGEVDSYLVPEVTVDGDNVVFGWELTPKVTMYKGNVSFVMCVVGPDTKVKWHTTLGRGQVLEGLEPDSAIIEEGTADVVAALITMVEAQTEAVADEGAAQIKAVQTAAQVAQSDAVAQIEAKGVNTRNSIPEDYTAVQSAVDGVVRGKAPAIVCSAEGSAITVNDASDLPMQGMKIFGRSTQDGTPTPEAPVEIVSVENPVVTVCGKNLCPENAFDTMSSNGAATAYDATTHTITLNATAMTQSGRYYPPIKNMVIGKPYTISFDIKGTAGKIAYCGWSDKNTKIVLTDTFVRYNCTLYATADRMPVIFYTEKTAQGGLDVGEYLQFANVQIEMGTAATDYEQYEALQTVEITHTLPGIPVTSGGNYTDSDGQQWVCDEVDLERGVYVQRVKTVVLNGAESWQKNIETDNDNYLYFLRVNDVGGDSSMCDSLQKKASNTMNRSGVSADHMGVYVSKTYQVIYMNICMLLSENSVAGLKNALSQKKITIHYPLATPIETPISETEIAAYRALHSNYPNTTVLNDAGAHMVVKYAADTKLYIDNKIAALVGG